MTYGRVIVFDNALTGINAKSHTAVCGTVQKISGLLIFLDQSASFLVSVEPSRNTAMFFFGGFSDHCCGRT